MFRYIEKFIFHKQPKDNFNLFIDLPELIQNYINEGFLTWSKYNCYVLQEKVFTITNKYQMAYTAKTVPVKTFRALATSNDLTGYVQSSTLSDYATVVYVRDELASNVTSEEQKIQAVATLLGDQLIEATGAEELVNQAITASVSNLSDVLDVKYAELKSSTTSLTASIVEINTDLSAVESTLDSVYNATVRIQDHLAI